MKGVVRNLLATAAACAIASSAWADDAGDPNASSELDTIKVIGITPQQGAELPESAIPYNVQTTTAGQLDRSQTFNITDYMNRNLTGVTINSAQSNPLQPNLQFRGFTASPLLGGSEGVSVYVDGVRVNEVFGDSVNWDLIPEEIISTMSVISGANPVYGLNTLGGAIEITTRNGFTDPALHIQSTDGSWGRDETSIQGGGNNGTWGWYGVADHFEERGWRDYSNSNANNFLATGSYRSGSAALDLHLAHAESTLNGNGASPLDSVAIRPQAVFTAPDRTQNYYDLINLQGRYKFNDGSVLSGTLFGRQVNTRSYNGDATDFNACDDDPEFPMRRRRPSRARPERQSPRHRLQRHQQHRRAQAAQLGWFAAMGLQAAAVRHGQPVRHGTRLRRRPRQLFLDRRSLAPDRRRLAAAEFDHPSRFRRVRARRGPAHSRDRSHRRFVRHRYAEPDRQTRAHRVRALQPHPRDDERSQRRRSRFERRSSLLAAQSRHRARVSSELVAQLYGGYNESTRAPTAVELACASPDAPCKLPNEFVADPDLKQVVAKNWEAGVRGSFDGGVFGPTRWKAGLFRTTNDDDIIFQATGGAQSNEGFFANVGRTRRQGVESSIAGKMFDNRLDWFANYTYLDATFRTPFEEISANHPDADPDTGLIQVVKGDRLPGLPRNAFKFGLDYALSPQLTVGGDMMINSAQYYRGDEANLLPPLGGFAVVNLRAVYRVIPHVSLFARVQNLFDRRYSDFGVIGNASTVLPQFTDPRLVSPGAPRAQWIGVSIDF